MLLMPGLLQALGCSELSTATEAETVNGLLKCPGRLSEAREGGSHRGLLVPRFRYQKKNFDPSLPNSSLLRNLLREQKGMLNQGLDTTLTHYHSLLFLGRGKQAKADISEGTFL